MPDFARAVINFRQPPPRTRRRIGWQIRWRKPIDALDFTLASSLATNPARSAKQQDVIAAECRVIGVNSEQLRVAGQFDSGLLGEFSPDRKNRRLTGFNATARQMPAIDIGVFYQGNTAIRPFGDRPHTQGRTARQTPASLHEGPRQRLDPRAPSHTDTRTGHSGDSALCTLIDLACPEIFSMYALIAVGLVVAVFAILNLIEYRRLD